MSYGQVSDGEIFARENISANVEDVVAQIIATVIQKGDAALYDYAAKFDKAELSCLEVTPEEIDEAYEANAGVVIADTFESSGLDYIAVPGVLCKSHGVFTWGKNAHEAVHNAVVVEECAKMAARTELLNPHVCPAPQAMQDKHYYRKHGANAYYGQK